MSHKLSPETENVPLTEFTPGECGVITELGTNGTSSRLQSMGICLGRMVEVVKTGDPLILRVYGTRIGLSGRLAERIELERCGHAGRCWEKGATRG